MAIEVLNRQRLASVDRKRVARVAKATLTAVNEQRRGITVVFVSDRKIRDLNREFRGKAQSTDVLAFPLDEPGSSPGSAGVLPASPQLGSNEYLGDVVVSAETALRQAREARHSLDREVDELVLHGVLHLCGYDHETDSGRMNKLELKLRKKLLDR
ncbi:MAG TPA: rRNA maturation RNase YbeY [Blastocatellia bacterium]|nr:rRNA maturation RNase YbeY [Blastocatellia bacterium]